MTSSEPYPAPVVSYRRKLPSLDANRIEAFAQLLRTRLRIQFSCLVTGDTELHRLNARFRGKNYPTDVLSFPGSRELAISYPRARAQAARFRHSPESEIEILMLHGALHLLGLDHESDNGQMARREALWRRKLGLPHGLIQRASA